MTPASVDLTIYQGATFSREFRWQTGTPAADVNLTGYTARMQIRRKLTDEDVVLELTTANGGIVITNAAQGRFTLNATATQTEALEIRSGVYDVEFVSGATVTRLLQGAVTVSPEVTRP